MVATARNRLASTLIPSSRMLVATLIRSSSESTLYRHRLQTKRTAPSAVLASLSLKRPCSSAAAVPSCRPSASVANTAFSSSDGSPSHLLLLLRAPPRLTTILSQLCVPASRKQSVTIRCTSRLPASALGALITSLRIGGV
eukprot:160810-Prorocentrum_minimum.AAC.1